MNWTTYWWEIVDEDSPYCGEEFFTALPDNAGSGEHYHHARNLFPGVKLKCHGYITEEEAEMMGLDTY